MQEKRIWAVNCQMNGFEFKVFIRCHEEYLSSYLDSELECVVRSYCGASQAEVDAAHGMGLKIYCYK